MNLIDIGGNQYNLDDFEAPVIKAGAILYDGRNPDQFHIDYIDDKDERHVVKGYPLHHMFISHSKVLIHLFIEHMRQGGAPVYQIIGVITLKIEPNEVQDMVLMGTYPIIGDHPELDPDDKHYVWINKECEARVRLYIPPEIKAREDYLAIPSDWSVTNVTKPTKLKESKESKEPNKDKSLKRRDRRYN